MSKAKAEKPPAKEQLPMFAADLIAPDPVLVARKKEQEIADSKARRRAAAEAVKREDAFVAAKIAEFNKRTGL